jgi:uncharacterized protein (TIGR02266 family)
VTKKQPRESARVNLSIIVELPDGTSMSSSFCRNISEKGLFLELYPLIPVGEKVRLSFRLPTRNRPLLLEGIVRWSRDDDPAQGPAGIGIEFTQLTHDQIEELRVELDYFTEQYS